MQPAAAISSGHLRRHMAHLQLQRRRLSGHLRRHRTHLQLQRRTATIYRRPLQHPPPAAVAQGRWPFAPHRAATFMQTSKAWSEAVMAFAAGVAKKQVSFGSHGNRMASGARSTNSHGENRYSVVRHSMPIIVPRCGIFLLGPFFSPYRAIAWPIYVASCFAASFSIALPIYFALLCSQLFTCMANLCGLLLRKHCFCVMPCESEA